MTGVLEFYNANLESIMQYRDLKTEVFQAFREVGNIILFCLRVEEQLVRTSQTQYFQIFMRAVVFLRKLGVYILKKYFLMLKKNYGMVKML